MALLRTPLWMQVVAAFALGALAGLVVGPDAERLFGWLGDIYVNLIRMLVVPLVFLTVATSLPRLAGVGDAARLAGRTLAWFVATSIAAVAIGLLFGAFVLPDRAGPIVAQPVAAKDIPTFLEVLVGLAPSNVFAAFAEGKVLQVLIIAALVGAGLLALGERTARLRALFDEGAALVFRITRWIIRLTPIGVFGLIAEVVGRYGLTTLAPLADFILTVIAACAVHIALVYGGLIKAHGLSVRRFFTGALAAQQTAFATSSSVATLPVSMRTVVKRFGVPQAYAGFAMPLAANMKMDACGAIFPAISAIFIARFFGIDLSAGQYLAIAGTAVLGTLATAGVPGTAVVMLTLTLGAAGLPLEGIGLLAAVDRVVDMFRTATNVTGQMLVPTIVAKEEGILDRAVYDGLAEARSEALPGDHEAQPSM
jgi:Na+/H+-dicarboxylate symporter